LTAASSFLTGSRASCHEDMGMMPGTIGTENVGVVEHLSDDESTTKINLLFQVLNQLFRIVVVIAALWVTSDTNVEVVTVGLLDVLDEILCVSEASASSLPLFLVTRRVTSESENVCTASVVGLFQSIIDL
ncbi:hypothetical protein KCU83_g529, partial [Aureobasidium melanogenum]